MPQQSPVDEAIALLDEVVRECNAGSPGAGSVLRRCSQGALLIGEVEKSAEFRTQISGYPADAQLPGYRVLPGSLRWRNEHFTEFAANDIAAKQRSLEGHQPLAGDFFIRDGISGLENIKRNGGISRRMNYPPQEVHLENGFGAQGRQMYRTTTVLAWEMVSADDISLLIENIREKAFNWAVDTMIRLKYQSRITTIWESYRSEVDQKLAELELNSHLGAIDRQVGSDNEQEWRSALLSCRNVLQDVSDYLWKTPATQVMIPRFNSNTLEMTGCAQHQYIARIKAYLHYNHLEGEERTLTSAEAEMLGNFIGRVNNFANRGHGSVTRSIAESGALYTYMVLSSLIRLTSMDPLTELPEGTFTI